MHQRIPRDFDIRRMREGDSHHLVNIDLKTSEFPYDFEDWQLLGNYFQDWHIWVATDSQKPVAFAVVEIDENEHIARMHRIACLPEGKTIGIHNLLLMTLEGNYCQQKLKGIEMPVPHTMCMADNDPYNVSVWLKSHGYKCIRTVPDMFDGYGKDIEGYIFFKPCGVTNELPIH